MSTIVVGVDGSSESRAAARWALDEARRRGAELRAVYAWSFPFMAANVGSPPLHEEKLFEAARQGAQAILDGEVAALRAEARDVVVQPTLVEAPASQALVDEAAGADLVVVGSRGRGGFTGLLLGSVSQQVAHHAPCPVVIVRT